MKLIDEWRLIARKAWSFKLTLISAGLGAIEVALPFFSDAFPQHIFGGLSALVALAAAIARLIAQKAINDPDSQ